MATIKFNKFEQLDEGVLGYISDVISSEFFKALFPEKLAGDIHNAISKKLKFIKSGTAKTEKDIKDLETFMAYMERTKRQLVHEFIIEYLKMLNNIYIPQATPTDLTKLRYVKTKPKDHVKFIPDADIRVLEKFIIKYLDDFEKAIRSTYKDDYQYTDTLLRTKLEDKIKRVEGFSKVVNTFIDTGGIVGAVRGKKISIYSQITNFMRQVVDTMREIEELKQEMVVLKKKLDDQKRVNK